MSRSTTPNLLGHVSLAATGEGSSLPTATRIVTCLLVSAGLFIAFFELGGYRALTDHEAYAAVPAREMLASGDWIVPRFGGLPRLEKTPLAYWLIAGASWLCGRCDAWVARLPSTLAMLGLALLMAHWAGRRWGRVGALAAAAAQLSSGYVLAFGRKAEVDMVLCLLTTTALYLVAHQPEDEEGRRSARRWTAIHLLVGLSFLAKFHYGPVMVLAPFVVFQLVQRTPRRLWSACQRLGLVILAACIVVWPSLVLLREPAAVATWWHETVHRALPGVFEDQPFWFYVPHLVGLTMPWTPIALCSVRSSWRRAWRRASAQDRFLWTWFAVQLAIMTISANKHRHYLLAALPVFSLLVAETVARWTRRRRSTGRPLFSPRFAIVWLLGATVVGGLAHRQAVTLWPDLATAIHVIAALGLATASLATTLFVRRREVWAIGVTTVGVVVCYGIVQARVSPRIDHRAELVRFAEEVRTHVGDQPVQVFDLGKSPTVFYLGEPLRRVESLDEVHALAGDEPVFVFTEMARASDIVLGAPAYVVTQQRPTPVTEGLGIGRTLILLELLPRAEPARPGVPPPSGRPSQVR